ncbi:MAG: ornithine carbamoyltransferase [Spirochaetes bacterium]|nr:ornithine carbamoyltransferase [Spirochaetota bacterium]
MIGKIPKVKTKDLLSVTDFSKEEMIAIFEYTKKMKDELNQGKTHNFLEGKTLGMIFEKTSTRTRVSFEVAMFQLGGYALFLSRDDIQLGRGETVGDTARVLSRYLDGIIIRCYAHTTALELAENATIPVINGLTDTFHPCQALADFYTIYERNKNFKNEKLAFVGDGNNVAQSLMLTAAMLGVNFALACPKGYYPAKNVVEMAFSIASKSGSVITLTGDIAMAVEQATYLYTDVWVSMGQEKEASRRRKDFAKYKITMKILDKCAPNCKVMHCLPAHRGEEITDEVIDSPQSIVLDQAENRLHVQKAILCALMVK